MKWFVCYVQHPFGAGMRPEFYHDVVDVHPFAFIKRVIDANPKSSRFALVSYQALGVTDQQELAKIGGALAA